MRQTLFALWQRVDPNCFDGGRVDETVVDCDCDLRTKGLLGCAERSLKSLPKETKYRRGGKG